MIAFGSESTFTMFFIIHLIVLSSFFLLSFSFHLGIFYLLIYLSLIPKYSAKSNAFELY